MLHDMLRPKLCKSLIDLYGNAVPESTDPLEPGMIFYSASCFSHVFISIVNRYTEDGHCKGPVAKRELRPIRLQWDLPNDCIDVIESSLRVAQAIASDVDLHIQVNTCCLLHQ